MASPTKARYSLLEGTRVVLAGGATLVMVDER
jgi:hypothetical protein